MAGPTRSPTSARPPPNPLSQPPRPPNAWILYRSDKLRTLTPPPPGVPRRPQADISKTISALWKSESQEVRSHYERLSDIKKAEHQAMYPGYRFQPVKKADRERWRLEQKLEKEKEKELNGGKKAKRRPPGPSEPYPYAPDSRFGHAGLSPPLSTAPSPSDYRPYPPMESFDPSYLPGASSPLTPQSFINGHDYSPRMHATPPMYPAPPRPTHLPSITAPRPSIPLRQHAEHWSQQALISEADAVAGHHMPLWNSSDGQFDTLDQNFVTLSFPRGCLPLPGGSAYPEPASWSQEESDMSSLDPALHAQLVPTDDPSIFELSGLDHHSLLAHPDGEIELSMGSGFALDGASDFSAFSSLFNLLGGTGNEETSPNGSSPAMEDVGDLLNSFLALSQDVEPTENIQENSPASAAAGDAKEHGQAHQTRETPLPLEATSHPLTPASVDSAPSPPVGPSHVAFAPSPSPAFAPPSGAIFTSGRRVAATWSPRG